MQQPNLNFEYRYGFSMPQNYSFISKKGLNEEIVRNISKIKNEPEWMTDFRLNSLKTFFQKKMPDWGADLSAIDFNNIIYYIRPTDKQVNSWSDLPQEIKETYDRIGVPQAEKKFLAGVSAQYECLTGDSLVFTNHGVKGIKDLKPSTYVYSLNELTHKIERQQVLATICKGTRPVYKVSTIGRELKCTINHPLLVLNYEKKQQAKRGKFYVNWKYLSELQKGDYIGIVKDLPDNGKPYKLPRINFIKEFNGKNQYKNFKVVSNYLYTRKNKNLIIPKFTTEELMWILGLYLGDGYISHSSKHYEVLSFAIPKNDKTTRRKIQTYLRKVFNYKLSNRTKEFFRQRISSTPIIEFFKKCGFQGKALTKKLPMWVFSLPNSQKKALIGGYIDSDGYVSNFKKDSKATITSANRRLLQSIQLLSISAGLRASSIFSFKSTSIFNKPEGNIAFRLQINGDLTELSDYSIKTKNNFVPHQYYHQFASHHKSPIASHISDQIGFAEIKNIDFYGYEKVYDIEVEKHHNFIANGIIVHNSEVVYESISRELKKTGVIFCDMDTALRQYPKIVKKYFGKLIPPHDNKFAALNSAVWSGGSFVYVPKGVKANLPLQAYFRINAERFGQFERTLIIAEKGSYVHYIEGCSAPIYTMDSLHAAVVEIFVHKNARVRYTTVQNWSNNVYNLVTKRARAEENAVMEWVDCNIGSKVTMKYPSVYLFGKGSKGEVLSIAYAGKNQHQDAGAKMFHFAPNTSSRIISKSISKSGGRTSYRGLVQVMPGAKNSSVFVSCDALILDEKSRSDTYPYMKIKESDTTVQHEATVEKIGEEKLFYLTAKGISKTDAEGLLVNGFIEPVTKEIPLEYSIELNRLINLEMSGSVG